MNNIQRREEMVFGTASFRPEELEPHFSALERHFPDLPLEGARKYANSLRGVPLPFGAEGLYLVPQWDKVAEDRVSASRKVIELLGEDSGTCHHWGQNALKRLRTQNRTFWGLGEIARRQNNNDVLIMPAQMGHFHAGRSIDVVRAELFPQEFCLGLFEVGCMLLCNPHRLVFEHHRFVDCGGDTCYPGHGPDSASSPYFSATADGHLELATQMVDIASAKHGPATGFIFP